MKEKNITYYLIWEMTVAKRVKRETYYEDYLFREGKWFKDEGHVIMDHLVGYDASEPEDSPYRIGSTSVLMEMDEISEKEAVSVMNQQILALLKGKWRDKFTEKKQAWDKAPGWPAKLVKTTFMLNGKKYTIGPKAIGLSSDCWDQGFMESIQGDISKDLEEYGAADIYNSGYLD